MHFYKNPFYDFSLLISLSPSVPIKDTVGKNRIIETTVFPVLFNPLWYIYWTLIENISIH